MSNKSEARRIALETAMALPTAAYLTPKLAHIRDTEAVRASLNGPCVTDATSEIPVIGGDTAGYFGCIVYDPKLKAGTILLDSDNFGKIRHESALWADKDRMATGPVDVHIFGFSKQTQDRIYPIDSSEDCKFTTSEDLEKSVQRLRQRSPEFSVPENSEFLMRHYQQEKDRENARYLAFQLETAAQRDAKIARMVDAFAQYMKKSAQDPHPRINAAQAEALTEAYKEMLHNVRERGFSPDEKSPVHSIDFASETNKEMMREMKICLAVLERFPHYTLKTFDVFDKPKPISVALDTRTGKLIRGSDLVTTKEAVNTYCMDFPSSAYDAFPCWHDAPDVAQAFLGERGFDGRLMQKQRGR